MTKEPAQRPKNKAPRKAPKKRQSKTYSVSKVASVELPKGRTLSVVRHEAGLRYIYDVNQNTVEWWHEQHYASECSLAAFRSWCVDDAWVSQRERHWEQVFTAVARELAGEMTQAHINEAKDLLDIRNVAFAHIRGRDKDGRAVALPEMKSYEGMVGAFVRLDERLDKKREGLLGSLPLGSGADDGSSTPTGVEFTPEEYRAMAQAVLKERQSLPESTESQTQTVGKAEKGS